MAIANVEMTGKWEAELARIERGEASADGFTHSIEGYTREITAELLGCDRLFSHKVPAASVLNASKVPCSSSER